MEIFSKHLSTWLQKFSFVKHFSHSSFQYFSFHLLSQLFLALFLVLFSFQIRTLIFAQPLHSSGNFNVYTSFFVYFNDFILALSFLFFGLAVFKNEIQFTYGNKKVFGLLVVFLLVNFLGGLLNGANPVHFFHLFRWFELFLLYVLLQNNVLTSRKAISFFLGGMFFQAFLAIFQYIFQSSVGLSFLGEPIATANTPGVAKMDFGGEKILRAFGTFPHANVLGGAMVFAFLLGWKEFKGYTRIFALLLFGLALLLSFSRSAFLALGIGFIVVLFLKKNFKILLVGGIFIASVFTLSFIFGFGEVLLQRVFFDQSNAISERILYAQMSKNMLFQYPFGVGLGGFTEIMQDFTDIKLMPWLFQPVHNVFLLALNEAGVLGGMLFIAILILGGTDLIKNVTKLKNQEELLLAAFFALLTISLFDHYFWTLYSGQVMVFFILGLIKRSS